MEIKSHLYMEFKVFYLRYFYASIVQYTHTAKVTTLSFLKRLLSPTCK